uniref:F5/8 type C domain-containing protein n=1 Tax=Heterorhabditis bacteriophora TaxID=37862 RepID=A0A1I7X3V5_HETBA
MLDLKKYLDHCASFPLGMESGVIKDTQISASSSFDKQSVGPQNSRGRIDESYVLEEQRVPS